MATEPDISRLSISSQEQQRQQQQEQEQQSPPANTSALTTCPICCNEVPSSTLHALGCSHIYCSSCLLNLIITSLPTTPSPSSIPNIISNTHSDSNANMNTNSLSLFPPKCCNTPLEDSLSIPHLLLHETKTPHLLAAYEEREIEKSTPANQRIHCANKACGVFLPEARVREEGSGVACRVCWVRTCGYCGCFAHRGGGEGDGVVRCEDFGWVGGVEERRALRALRELGRERGWVVCRGCGELTVRVSGCRHVE